MNHKCLSRSLTLRLRQLSQIRPCSSTNRQAVKSDIPLNDSIEKGGENVNLGEFPLSSRCDEGEMSSSSSLEEDARMTAFSPPAEVDSSSLSLIDYQQSETALAPLHHRQSLARRRLYAPVETVLGRVECTLRDRFELALLIKHEGLRRDWGWLKRRWQGVAILIVMVATTSVAGFEWWRLKKPPPETTPKLLPQHTNTLVIYGTHVGYFK